MLYKIAIHALIQYLTWKTPKTNNQSVNQNWMDGWIFPSIQSAIHFVLLIQVQVVRTAVRAEKPRLPSPQPPVGDTEMYLSQPRNVISLASPGLEPPHQYEIPGILQQASWSDSRTTSAGSSVYHCSLLSAGPTVLIPMAFMLCLRGIVVKTVNICDTKWADPDLKVS